MKVVQQPGGIVQIKAGVGRIAFLNKVLHHGDQWWTASLEIGWQQGKEMVVIDGSEKELETALGVTQVELEIRQVVATRWRTCRATTGKHHSLGPFSGLDGVGFKERDGEKRYLLEGRDRSDVDCQVF